MEFFSDQMGISRACLQHIKRLEFFEPYSSCVYPLFEGRVWKENDITNVDLFPPVESGL
jgi:hypothetical protein